MNEMRSQFRAYYKMCEKNFKITIQGTKSGSEFYPVSVSYRNDPHFSYAFEENQKISSLFSPKKQEIRQILVWQGSHFSNLNTYRIMVR